MTGTEWALICLLIACGPLLLLAQYVSGWMRGDGDE